MKKFIIFLLLSVIVNNVSAAESFAAAADRREKEVATLDQKIQALTEEVKQLNTQLGILMADPESDPKNIEALATQLDQALAKNHGLKKEKEIKTLEKELSPRLVNPEIHQDRIVAINERLAQLKKASKSSNINDQEILPFEISSDYLTHFQKARQKRKTESQTYKPTQKELLTPQLEKSKRRLGELREQLEMQEDFVKRENSIESLEEEDKENIKPLFNLEDFPYLYKYYEDFFLKNRFFSIKSKESLQKIKQEDRIRAEEKRQELIERLKQEIEKVTKQKEIFQRWSILEPLWFSTDNLLLHLPSKIYQLPDQEKDDIDEEIDFL